jgi:hypothetical protein
MKNNSRIILFFIPAVILLAAGGIMISGCSSLSVKLDADDMVRIEQSPNYDKQAGKFVNRRPGIVQENMDKNFNLLDFIGWFKGTEYGVPKNRLPEEAAQAYFDLKSKRYFPIHWCMFELALHPWFGPARDIAKEADARGINLVTPMLGEMVTVDGKLKSGRWWEPLVACNPGRWRKEPVYIHLSSRRVKRGGILSQI